MKNRLWIVLIILTIVLLGIGIYFFNKFSNSNNNDYTASKTSINESTNNSPNNSLANNENNTKETNILTAEQPKKEEQLTSFSTKIYTKDAGRQNNVTITCQTLNNTIVSNGSEFSFCNTVGQSSPARGYQKAEIFDAKGNKIQGYGGGNCQISSTLYNAILQVPKLTVTERHQHSNKVPYIQTGKDAAVAYGSYDLKFVNNSGYDIKISAENTADNITITLYRLA